MILSQNVYFKAHPESALVAPPKPKPTEKVTTTKSSTTTERPSTTTTSTTTTTTSNFVETTKTVLVAVEPVDPDKQNPWIVGQIPKNLYCFGTELKIEISEFLDLIIF